MSWVMIHSDSLPCLIFFSVLIPPNQFNQNMESVRAIHLPRHLLNDSSVIPLHIYQNLEMWTYFSPALQFGRYTLWICIDDYTVGFSVQLLCRLHDCTTFEPF